MNDSVLVYEVGPRDGLQNESAVIPTPGKIALIDLLSQTGLRKIEATSFVSPKWVPQLADAAEVMAGIARVPGVTYAALTPNLRGLDRALAAGIDEVAVFAAASETFSRRNINCSIAESFDRFRPVVAAASGAGIPVRGYVSCAIACPYEGAVDPQAVRGAAERLLEIGCYEVSLGDTIGAGTPETVGQLLDALLATLPADRLAGHFHDTANRALDNVRSALDFGLRTFDSAVGGLGGCPYAPGAKGNLDTGALVAMLEGAGYSTGVDLTALAPAERHLAELTRPMAPAAEGGVR